jgi:hypothetical protein
LKAVPLIHSNDFGSLTYWPDVFRRCTTGGNCVGNPMFLEALPLVNSIFSEVVQLAVTV